MSTNDEMAGVGCGIVIGLIIVIALGGFCVDYVTNVCWGKDLPTWADCCIGFLTSGLAITAALVCVIVEACDVETPFWGGDVAPVVAPMTQPAT